MKINKNFQTVRFFKIIALVVPVGVLLFFVSYYLGSFLLESDKNSKEDIHNQTTLPISKEQMEKIRENEIQVSVITGKIVEIKDDVVIISSQIYGQEEKIVKIRPNKSISIYRYPEVTESNDDELSQANYGEKEELQLSDLRPGELITFSLENSVSLAEIEEVILEISEILVNQNTVVNEM
jgi:hypothetical protein